MPAIKASSRIVTITAGIRGASFGAALRPNTSVENPVAASAWYLTTGLVAGDVVRAYCTFGAADYAASLVNLNNPGTGDADGSVSPPTWNAADGWIFDGLSQYLDTGAEPASTWSMIIRFTGFASPNRFIFGVGNAITSHYYSIQPVTDGNHYYTVGSGYVPIAGDLTSGILGVSQYQGYKNGLPDGDPKGSDAWVVPGDGLTILIGCVNWAGDSPAYFSEVNVQAFALYNKPLSDAQMLATMTAMAAL